MIAVAACAERHGAGLLLLEVGIRTEAAIGRYARADTTTPIGRFLERRIGTPTPQGLTGGSAPHALG